MSSSGKAQTYLEIFRNTKFPEKWWFISHPLVAPKAIKITRLARSIANDKITDPDLDGDYAGGQVDAFRHALWMALLTKEIGKKKALSLGVAHEKSNKIEYKRSNLEEGIIPDLISTEMDLYNNERGAAIGEQAKFLTTEQIVELVKLAVLDGRLKKIRKNKKGEFLNDNGELIPETEWKGKWENTKVLIQTNIIDP